MKLKPYVARSSANAWTPMRATNPAGGLGSFRATRTHRRGASKKETQCTDRAMGQTLQPRSIVIAANPDRGDLLPVFS